MNWTAWLISCGIHPTQAKPFGALLGGVFDRFQIDTVEQRAAFIAQFAHESTMFTQLEELLYYRTPERIHLVWPETFKTVYMAAPYARNPQKLANFVYANRNGNGDEASGDGWKYRGRGMGLTGRENYEAAAIALGRPYVDMPALVSEPEDALLTGAHFWVENDCNDMMLSGDFDGTSRRINGKGWVRTAKERRGLFASCREALREMVNPNERTAA